MFACAHSSQPSKAGVWQADVSLDKAPPRCIAKEERGSCKSKCVWGGGGGGGGEPSLRMGGGTAMPVDMPLNSSASG
jgi:hypothetical protein